MRIKSYVGKLPRPLNYEDGAEIIRRLFDHQFPKLGAADWLAAAQRMWRVDKKRMVPTYDVKLAKTLAGITPETSLPAIWNQFDALGRVPVMVVRGENSDILSAETVAAMAARRPDLVTIEVLDQGHTPLLAESDMIARIAVFIDSCERKAASH
jgi:pimeloyl-ACP methyl ester carboxylesterase